MSADNFLLDNDSILYDTVSVSCEPLYDNIHYVTLKGTNSKYAWIREAHYNFIGLPEFESGKDYPLVIRFNYRAKASGLAVFHKGTTFPAIFSIAPTDEFVTKTIETTWNGTGDFELRSNTEIDIYGISIYTETTEAKYRTFFDQSEKFIKFGSTHIDNDGNILNGAEVRVETEGDKSGTYIEVVYQEGKETKRQTLGEFSTQDGKTKVKFSGDNVILEGDVTANGKVQIREDGSLVAHNGYFTGILANQFLDVTKDNFYNIFENVSTEENHNSWEIKKEYFSPFIRFWYYPTEDETGKTQFPRFRLPHFKFSKWSEDEVFCLIGKMFYVVDKSGYDNINGKLKVVYITGYGAGFTNEVTEYPQGFYMCRYKNGVVYYEHINEI